MLKDILEPHAWLCCARGDLDSLVKENGGFVHLLGLYWFVSVASISPPCPGVVAWAELPGPSRGFQGGRAWVPMGAGLRSQL